MRFAGELIDTETSLYHLRARQYDPGSGRFLSVDPLSPELVDPSASAYVSADNDPTAFIDPSGLWCHSVLHCLNAIGSFIERHPVTVGGCASASLFGYHASAQGSVGLTVGTRGSVGVTATLGGGFSATAGGPPEASITRGVQITNAPCVADLGGLFYDVGGSGGLDYAGSADYFTGKGAVMHGPVAGGTVGTGNGAGVEIHAGPTETGTESLGRSCK